MHITIDRHLSNLLAETYCGKYTSNPSLVSKSNEMTIRFVTSSTGQSESRKGFELHYTAFHTGWLRIVY